jgi:23S rRNA (cytosine1962-C5)-methyltransferase
MIVKLKKDLIRDIKRGHPWVYQGALEPLKSDRPGFAKLVDRKGLFLAWGVLDPQSALQFRVVSFDKAPVNQDFLKKQLLQVLARKSFLFTEHTTGVRLINGEGDGFPGLICDIFGDVGVLQTDGQQLDQVWDLPWFAEQILRERKLAAVIFKPQRSKNAEAHVLVGSWGVDKVAFLENRISFEADVLKGQKTGFFLDQRNNRALIRKLSLKKDVLNLFSYTGGFSVAAGVGGASSVESVDLSPYAVDACTVHWRLNGLESANHVGHAQDVFQFLENKKSEYDIVIVDPPSFASSRSHRESAKESYTHLYTKSAQAVRAQGLLGLSSCSSHVDFEMFYDICLETLSRARRRGRVVAIQGQPEDHPFPLACPELRYLKFFLLQLF